jgi:hypothetical protein
MRFMYETAAESTINVTFESGDPFYDDFPWFRLVGRYDYEIKKRSAQLHFLFSSFHCSFFPFFLFYDRSFVYLSNLVYGISLEQTTPIISETGELQGHLLISIQQCEG